jgi:hypothetical protein
LVHGSPQVVPIAPDLHEYLIQVPHISQPPLSTFELSCVLRPELPAPRILEARPLLLTWSCQSTRYPRNKERLS